MNPVKPLDPKLLLAPPAWAKLLLAAKEPTEVGMLGIANDPLEPLRITDLKVISQVSSAAYFEFEEDPLSDFYAEMLDKGFLLEQFSRVLVHTHPKHCNDFSWTDEDTVERYLGKCAWGVSTILPKGGLPKALLVVNVRTSTFDSPDIPTLRIQQEIPVEVDWDSPFEGSDFEAWRRELAESVKVRERAIMESPKVEPGTRGILDIDTLEGWYSDWLYTWEA